ncbi:DUF1287 domain-containing protein [Bacteroides sp. 51]|uniref:DUF1287 domain-containing protein n=1 Tax=Bacteroides sp. 51 TaxID=2302938 RepID=UPI0013D7F09A|nr:DUF1287 domain-containing protein [Bacteroides sp. 51]NDV81039.1 DUF1287 domain-containing protein [Bacteroides sp. 51]
MRTKLFLLICCCQFLGISQVFAQDDFYQRLVKATKEIINPSIKYDPSYVRLSYPGGDVPADRGVCTDVVIRAYRKLGIDLQKEVHEDMRANFSLYPTRWGMKTTDRNIDHRRVPNLMTFFSRKGQILPKSQKEEDYQPGDIVCWELPGNLPHIGIVIDRKVSGTNRYAVVHNIGRGQIAEDCLFAFKITGHYRYQK